MKFKINQMQLSKAISIVAKAVSTKTTMEILKGIYFEIEDDNLVLTANNLELGIQTNVPCEVYESGKIVIEAKIISDIIRKMPNDTIHFQSVEDTDFIELRCKNSKFNIKYLKCDDFPMPAYIDERTFVRLDAQDFKDLVLKTGYAISNNNPNPVYMSHFFKVEKDEFVMFSIDGFRFSFMKKRFEESSFDEKKLILKGNTLIDIAKTIEDSQESIKFSYDDKHICIIIDNTIITSNLIVGNFLDYESIIPQAPTSTAKIKLSDLKSAVERVSLLSNNKLIKFESKDFMMNITSRNDQIGDANEIVDIELNGENFTIAFNCDYILDAMKYIDDEYLIMNVINSVSPCTITPKSNEDYKNVVLPVRIR